jgi:diguanylate cyclase (GGDEF)-like protein
MIAWMKQAKPGTEWRGRRLGPTAGAVAWALLPVGVFLATYPLGTAGLWHGFLLATPFLVATSGLGWRAGLVLAPLGLGLLWLRTTLDGTGATLADYSMLLAVMALAALAGDRLYRAWRGAQRLAGQAGRRAKLLQEATVDLNHSADVDALFSSAPRLLSDILSFAHASVFVPRGQALEVHTTLRWGAEPGFTVPLQSVMGRAYTTAQPQYVVNTAADPDFIQAPGAELTRSEFALPVVVNGEVRAVLNLEHRTPGAFPPADHATLKAFVRMMEEVLARLDATEALSQTTKEQQFMARLNERLLLAEGLPEAADVALDEVLTWFGLDLGAVLEMHRARLRPVAVRGTPPPVLAQRLRDGFEFVGVLQHAWQTRQIVLVDDLAQEGAWTTTTEARALAAVPIVNPSGQVQALLVVARYQEPLPTWSERDRALLSTISAPLGAAFSRMTLNRQLLATLEVIRQLRSAAGPDALYHHAAQAALDLVPNTEAASILVRHGDHYYYEAAVGYDLETLQAHAGPFSYEEQLAWYQGSREEFDAGRGRVLRGPHIATASLTSRRTPVGVMPARMAEMRCQLAVPIVDGDQVVALLNLDNFSTEDAFSAAALRVAEAFAQHITVVVRQAEELVLLERSAVTDALTGLGNREGFERTFKQELARARRLERHLSLVLIDLDDFKQINDRFGHAEGDNALVAVARALADTARAGDHVFRWGGDEFALILPETQPQEALAAAARFREVLAGLDVNGVRVLGSFGLAGYPVDGIECASLMATADHRMYADKRKKVKASERARRLPPTAGVAG